MMWGQHHNTLSAHADALHSVKWVQLNDGCAQSQSQLIGRIIAADQKFQTIYWVNFSPLAYTARSLFYK